MDFLLHPQGKLLIQARSAPFYVLLMRYDPDSDIVWPDLYSYCTLSPLPRLGLNLNGGS